VTPETEKSLGCYLGRALLLRCPVCGTKPIFSALLHTRSLRDWFTPLDGCPRCGYPYEREPGYFLASTWLINYGAGSLLGIVIYAFLESFFHLDIGLLLLAVLSPIVLFNLLFARHSKALFIALDHFCDPHEKESGDEGGNLPLTPPPPQDRGGEAKSPETPDTPAKKPLLDLVH